jgi:hypothetical protein
MTGELKSEEPLNGSYRVGIMVGSDTDPDFVGYTTVTVTNGKAAFDMEGFTNVTDEYRGSLSSVVSIGSQGYETLEAALKAARGKTATITIKGDITIDSMISVAEANTHITLKGDGTERIITFSVKAEDPNSTAASFVLGGGSGVSLTLTLDAGVTLAGENFVSVGSGAALILKTGAKITGGGVYNYGTFTMKGGSITDTAGYGVYVGGTFTMQGGSITGNTGSGVHVGATYTVESRVYNGGTFTMTGGSIENNTASGFGGGGVYVGEGGTFTMQDGSITGNTASDGYGYGGGVYNGGTFTMQGGSIEDNTASGGGGGVSNSGTFTMTGGSIENNTTSNGGGGVSNNGGTFTLTGGSITGNSASGTYFPFGGGGVYVISGTFTMKGGVIQSNTASDGGGVSVWESGTFTMEGGSIAGNTAANAIGGHALYDARTKTVIDTTITSYP